MKTGKDVNGSVSERSAVVLVLIDVINRLDFEGAEKLVQFALPMARRIVALKKRAKARGIPTIYVNDNFGRWKSDFKAVVDRCLSDDSPGHRLVELLRPEADDYFVLKPKQSGFFGTPLSILLEYLQARTLILTGVAGNNCLLFTAHDAYLRNLQIIVPSDCIASETKRHNSEAYQANGKGAEGRHPSFNENSLFSAVEASEAEWIQVRPGDCLFEVGRHRKLAYYH